MSEKVLEMTIEELDLSVRSYNCLKRAGFDTVEQLCETTEEEIIKIRNLGKKSAEEVFQKLHSLGLYPRKEQMNTEKEIQSIAELGLTKTERLLLYGLNQFNVSEEDMKTIVLFLNEDEQVLMIHYLITHMNATPQDILRETERLLTQSNRL